MPLCWLGKAQYDYRLENIALKNGWQVTREPRIRDREEKLLKPDLFLTKDQHVIISDISVSWECPEPLSMAYAVKKAIYSTLTFLEMVEEQNPDKIVEVLPLIVGIREGWCLGDRSIIKMVGTTDAY